MCGWVGGLGGLGGRVCLVGWYDGWEAEINSNKSWVGVCGWGVSVGGELEWVGGSDSGGTNNKKWNIYRPRESEKINSSGWVFPS